METQSAEGIEVACLDPLEGTVGEFDRASYRLKAKTFSAKSDEKIILRLPGSEYADLKMSEPKVTAWLNGAPLEARPEKLPAACTSPSRTRYDLDITPPAGWSNGQSIRIDVENYRLPLRAISDMPVEILLSRGGKEIPLAIFRTGIRPGPAMALFIDAPSRIKTGMPIRIRASSVDGHGNPSRFPDGKLEMKIDEQPVPPPEIAFDQTGYAEFDLAPLAAGVHRIAVFREGRELGSTGPVVVDESTDGLKVLWGDLHSHTGFSDAYTTATPRDAYAYASRTAHLDFAAVTDHSEAVWGCPMPKENWAFTLDAAKEADAPGVFTTLPGFEWTGSYPFAPGWPVNEGHAHVLLREPAAPCRADTEECNSFAKLIARMTPLRPLVIRHHVCAQWAPSSFPKETVGIMPAVEIASSHGSCECPDCPEAMPDRIENGEYYVQSALMTGVRYGIVGGSDNHHARPGARRFNGKPFLALDAGALTCVLAERNTKEAIFDAIEARRCYATTSARILLDFRIGETKMGGVMKSASAVAGRIAVHSRKNLESVKVLRGDVEEKTFRTLAEFSPDDSSDFQSDFTDEHPPKRGFYYVRVRQKDGEMAWSSPIWIEP